MEPSLGMVRSGLLAMVFARSTRTAPGARILTSATEAIIDNALRG